MIAVPRPWSVFCQVNLRVDFNIRIFGRLTAETRFEFGGDQVQATISN